MKEMQTAINEAIDQCTLINNVSGTYRNVKRLFDFLISLTAVVLLFPVIAITAAVLKIRTRGPVLNIEEKCGLRGVGFNACEFSKDLEQNYIRKLPLLFNVLKGNMSLVGPRPMPIGIRSDDVWYNLRMSAKPGVVGLWQVSGKRGTVSEMVRVDLKYIRERSLWVDLKIFLKAIGLVFGIKRSNR